MARLPDEPRYVIVGIGPVVAAGTRAEQHDAFEPVAISLAKCCAKAFENRIVLRVCPHPLLHPRIIWCRARGGSILGGSDREARLAAGPADSVDHRGRHRRL